MSRRAADSFRRPDHEELLARVARHESVAAIAADVGVSTRTVERWLAGEGIRRDPKPGQIEHGSVTGYDYYRCRCDVCTEGNRLRCADARRARQAREIPAGMPHNRSTYVNWGCRCVLCTADHSAACRERRERRKAHAA